MRWICCHLRGDDSCSHQPPRQCLEDASHICYLRLHVGEQKADINQAILVHYRKDWEGEKVWKGWHPGYVTKDIVQVRDQVASVALHQALIDVHRVPGQAVWGHCSKPVHKLISSLRTVAFHHLRLHTRVEEENESSHDSIKEGDTRDYVLVEHNICDLSSDLCSNLTGVPHR